MTVYVDDYRHTATVGRLTGRWSHLLADDRLELDEFAARLGLRPAWIQRVDTPREHYDVTDRLRDLAIRLGAVPITVREAGHLVAAKRDGRMFDLARLRDTSTEQGSR